MKRIALFLAGSFMLIVFGTGVLVALPMFALALVWFLITGSVTAQEFVSFRGMSLDQVCNAVYLKGDPRETVSSHCGRFYEAKYGNPYKRRPATNPDLVIPWRVQFVHRLTSLAEKDHVLKAVQAPFVGMPL